MPDVKFTEKRRAAFLKELASTGLVNHSARLSGVCPMTVRNHREEDSEFDERVREALEDYAETVRQEVRRRAMVGLTQLKFYKGRPVYIQAIDPMTGAELVDENDEPILELYQEKLFSDRLLEMEAKRVDPAYRDKGSLDLNVKSGVLVVPGKMTKEEWEKEGQNDGSAKEG